MQPSDLLPAAHQQNAQAGADNTAVAEVDLPDVYIVNPGGRVVEVTGQHAEQLLLENGYRRATPAEYAPLEEYKKANAPAVLRRKEAIRVEQEKKAAEKYMSDLALDGDPEADQPEPPKQVAGKTLNSQPQNTAENQAQPSQPAQPASQPAQPSEPQTPNTPAENGSDEGTPKPPSRSNKK